MTSSRTMRVVSFLLYVLVAHVNYSACAALPTQRRTAIKDPSPERSQPRAHWQDHMPVDDPAAVPSAPQQRKGSNVPGLASAGVRTFDMPASTSDLDMRTLARPFIARNATVRGPVSAKLQAQLEAEEQAQSHSAAGSLRRLLHGSRPPMAFHKCAACSIIRCGRQADEHFCDGHCRQKRKLFHCESFSTTAASCLAEDVEDFIGLPPDSIGDFDTVVVTAPAPYIGCADIGNRPSGCPAPGTILPGQNGATVESSVCRSQYYAPTCSSVLLPFGVCECSYRETAPGHAGSYGAEQQLVQGLCKTTELPPGSGVGGADGSPSEDDIVVVPSGDVTQTWYSNATQPGQKAKYVYDLTASVAGVDVDVSMSFFPEPVRFTPDYLQAGEEIGEDYLEDYEAAPPQRVLDYTSDQTERDGEFELDTFY